VRAERERELGKSENKWRMRGKRFGTIYIQVFIWVEITKIPLLGLNFLRHVKKTLQLTEFKWDITPYSS